MKITILGAGISGLTAAWYLKKKYPTAAITIIEKSPRVGGWIATKKVDHFLFELGPRGFLSSGKGASTLELIEELGLSNSLVERSDRQRFLWTDRLEKLSWAFLWKKKCLSLLWQERNKPTYGLLDESIGHFFERRFNARFVHDFIDPLVRGIFGGDPYLLSMRSCFPRWYAMEQAYGSLLRGYLYSKKEKARFYSLVGGMETLPKTLQTKLEEKEVEILFNQEQYGPYDLLISTLPDPDIKRLSLTLVHMGFHIEVLRKKGFGYLTSDKKSQVLGMTFDSSRQLCLMLRGEVEENIAKSLAINALEKHLAITERPSILFVTQAKQAIAQYEVGHYKKVEKLATLPTIHIGTSYYGVGINDCIFQAQQMVSTLPVVHNRHSSAERKGLLRHP